MALPRKLLPAFCLCIGMSIPAVCSAQMLTADELIGVWRVNKVTVGDEVEKMPADAKAKLKGLMENITASTFTFNADRTAIINLKMGEFTLPKGCWFYDSTKGFITTIPWEERKLEKPSLLAGIIVRRFPKTGDIVFLMEESPFHFYVVKDKDKTPPARIRVSK